MKVTVEQYDKRFTIEVEDDLTANALFEDVFIPLAFVMGYHISNIKECVSENIEVMA